MLSIPFLKTTAKARTQRPPETVRPDPGKTLDEARAALRERNPQRALNLLAPLINAGDAPDETRLLAGRALAALERYPEALEHLEMYVAANPDSVKGLLCAGLVAASAREIAKAVDWFNRAARALGGRARAILEPLMNAEQPDPVAIEEMVADVESHPEDRDRALALACALGRAGHFRAVERFLPVLD